MRNLLTTLLAPVLLLPAVTLAQDAADRVDPETLSELTQEVAARRCEQVIGKLPPLRTRYPADPDLIALEANCEFALASTVQRNFDTRRYEWLKLATGAETLPRSVTAVLYRVERRFDQQRLDRALALFRKALELDRQREDLLTGAFAAHLDAGRAAEAATLLAEHQSRLGPQAFSSLGEIVQDQLRAGRVDLAQAAARAMISARPRAGHGHAALALVALQQGRDREAIESFRTARDLGYRHPAALRELARLELMARDTTGAIETLVPIAGNDPQLELWLALARSVSGETSALTIWDSVARRQPRDEKGKGQWSELITHYRRLLGGQSRPTAAMRLRGAQSLEKQGYLLPAMIEAAAAAELEPNRIDGWLFLLERYRRGLHLDLALEAADAALKLARLRPDASALTPAELGLARVRLLIGLERFRNARDEALALTAEQVDARYEQAVADIALGRTDEAASLLHALEKEGGGLSERASARLREIEGL